MDPVQPFFFYGLNYLNEHFQTRVSSQVVVYIENVPHRKHLTLNVYITVDPRAEHGSHPPVIAGDVGHDELLRCFLPRDRGEAPGALRQDSDT